MSYRSKPLAIAAVAVIAIAALAACSSSKSSSPSGASSSDSPLVAAAKKEGSLVLLSSALDTQLKPTVAAFTAKYGIKVSYQSVPTSPLVTKISGEKSAGKFVEDVVGLSDHSVLDGLNTAGDLAPINDVPNWAHYPADDRDNYSAVGTILPAAIVWNTDIVKKKINGWPDVIDSQFKGKIVTLDPSTSPVAVSIYTMLEKSFGDQYLTNLAALKPTYVPSSALLVQQVASGQSSIGLLVTLSAIPAVQKTGAPIDFMIPNPTSGPLQYFGALSKGPHPSAAKLFLDFVMSTEGQGALNTGGLGVSPLSGIAGVAQAPSFFQVPNTTLGDAQTNKIKGILNP
jgi:iron(III) transport system substrate-binding protein